jgi:hypothetical protein
MLKGKQMSRMQTLGRVEIPESLSAQLSNLRRKVWMTKLTEAAMAAIGGVALAYLAVFVMDRLGDTPAWLRAIATVAAIVACGAIPYCLHRWVWNKRRFYQLARMLSRRLPQVGDQLLGVIELSESDAEQARSRELCQAAIEQVASDVSKRDLAEAVPQSYWRTRIVVAGLTLAIVCSLLVAVPDAAKNAWVRFLAPWQDIARYTFAAVMPLKNEIVVPHGEEFTLDVSLLPDSKWQPDTAYVRLDSHRSLDAKLDKGRYHFTAPGQIARRPLKVSVGDWRQRLTIVPKTRPELSTVAVTVELPEYLKQSKKLEADARSGKLAVVQGSKATIRAAANRPLAWAAVDDHAAKPSEAMFTSTPIEVASSSKHELLWKDQDGLAGAKPFTLSIEAREDEAPVVGLEGLTPNQIVLDSEQLKFTVNGSDDFGVREVGMEWRGVPKPGMKAATGEKLIAAGHPEEPALSAQGLFTATSLGIEPQTIELRLYVTDYRPGRERAYSPAYTLHVLDQDEHAAWLMQEMAKFQKQALEVRDREMQLHETNLDIRALPVDRIQSNSVQQRIAAQANAEAANGRRLHTVAGYGARLVQQASRNPAMDANGVATMADMVVVLQDMADNRMPSIASLLKENNGGSAAGAPGAPIQNIVAGMVRSSGVQGRKKELVPGQAMPPGMQLSDTESSHQPGEDPPNEKAQKVKASASALSLPTTVLKGRPLKGELPDAQPGGLDQAIDEQRQLLEDFARLANEMSEILSKMEGATFIKRLKAASRDQSRIATDLSADALDFFGKFDVDVPKDEPTEPAAAETSTGNPTE